MFSEEDNRKVENIDIFFKYFREPKLTFFENRICSCMTTFDPGQFCACLCMYNI